ncbi:hypothetical protein MMC14_004766 [Varicellaria rhodocarpa]|nr:hypothetical protein [Varicellaria rhodocarpa]
MTAPFRTTRKTDDFSRLGDAEAGRALQITKESVVKEHQQCVSTVRETSTKVTSHRRPSDAGNNGSKSSQADDCDKLWAEVYEKMDHGSYEKYPQGWPRLASFLDGCSNFSIFRRFGHCATRILVSYTAKITMLEKELHDLDGTDALPDGKRYRLRNLEVGPDTIKEDLIASIESHLRKYYKFLLLYSQIRGMGQASKSDHDSVFLWMHLHKPLDQGQYDFIYHSEDFVSTVPPQRQNAIENLIWKFLSSWPKGWLMRTLGFEKASIQPKEETVKYLSEDRIPVVAKLIIAILAVTVFFIPIALFLLVPMSKACLTITVFVFLVVFAFMMSLFAEVGVQEMFIGIATYGAVMVTFLGNMQNSVPASPT